MNSDQCLVHAQLFKSCKTCAQVGKERVSSSLPQSRALRAARSGWPCRAARWLVALSSCHFASRGPASGPINAGAWRTSFQTWVRERSGQDSNHLHTRSAASRTTFLPPSSSHETVQQEISLTLGCFCQLFFFFLSFDFFFLCAITKSRPNV